MLSAPLRHLSTRLLPILALLALAAVLPWLTLSDAVQAQTPETQTVQADWPLIPEGVSPGESFRLLFVTSGTRDASASNIADYNAHVRAAAGNNSNLQSFKDAFTALISTSAVDAKDNTATTGTGVPVYWLGGEKVADDYADLYDGSWGSVSGRTESGASYTGLVWTGGNKRGVRSGQRHAGASEVRLGDLGDATMALSSPNAAAATEAYPLYALSPVITVAEPEPEPTPTPTPTPTPAPEPEPDNGPPTIASGPDITSSPQSGDTYGADDTIEISYTFGEAVVVTGGPKVRLVLGERKRWAQYDHSEGDGTILVFAYVVRSDDRDEDGVKVGKNQLKLNGGSIADTDGNAADLNHPALPDQEGHKVDGSQEEEPTEESRRGTANSEPHFASDTASRSVDENSAAGTNVGDPITATDADADALTYALSGSDAFAIDESTGQIAVVSTPDYETQFSHSVTVSVSDGKDAQGEADASADDSIAVTINVVNVDEPGRVILGVGENGLRAGQRLTATVLDPDGNASDVSWTWARSADQSTWETIAGATGATYTPTAGDVGQYLRAAGSYTDPQGSGKTAQTETPDPVAAAQEGQRQNIATTIWSATLTVDTVPGAAGCDDNDADQDNCSLVLRPNKFTFQGTEYTVGILYHTSAILIVAFNKDLPTTLSTATLHAGGKSFALTDNTSTGADRLRFSNPGLTWTDGQSVSVRLTIPNRLLQKPAQPTGLTATAGDQQVTLRWDDPKDSTITKYQVWHRPAADRQGGSWVDVPGGGSVFSYTVTGLENGTKYRFWLRAVNANGSGNAFLVDSTPIPALVTKKPDMPDVWDVTTGNRKVTFWVRNPNDPTITKYQVSYKYSQKWYDIPGSNADSTVLVVTDDVTDDLQNGVTENVSIRGVNALGAGPGTPIRQVTPGFPDSKTVHGVDVWGFKITPGDGQLRLNWRTQNPGVCGYAVEWRAAWGGAWERYEFNSSSHAPRHTITGLDRSTQYTVRVYVKSGYYNVPDGLAFEKTATTN